MALITESYLNGHKHYTGVRMALSGAHTSAKAADHAKVLIWLC